ncbi:MAG TPA: DUF1992 domain-containing protein [Candidatus Solibacter sp.]|nr:DUF1992 domain-containing protein [Candidatus Solibacter sp.]
MDVFRLIAERKIREAMDEGAFDHLDGKGAPLNLEENPYEDPAQRIAHRLLRNNGFAPAWILEAQEIDTETRRLKSNPTAPDRTKRVAALNRRIAAFNLKTPIVSTQRQLLDV